MSAHTPHQGDQDPEQDDDMLDPNDAEEEIVSDGDAAMDSGEEDDEQDVPLQEIQLQNDSAAHFDQHKDSIFCIASHPVHSNIIATGGGDDTGYIFDISGVDLKSAQPVLPKSYESGPSAPQEREGLAPLFKLEGHTDSLNGICFTYPKGAYVASAGLDGRLRVWAGTQDAQRWKFLAEAQEVEEINWISPCPHPEYPNTLALGASDGSVWVYTLNAADKASPITIVGTYYNHTGPCTAGAWTPDGKLLATVSEDASFYVWDPWGEAAAAGASDPLGGSQSVVGLTGEDERFRVDGGLYSVAVNPSGSFAAVGGTEGQIRIVSLPRLTPETAASATAGAKGAGPRSKAGGGKQAPSGSTGQAGMILASLQAGEDSVESISFSQPPLTLIAAGNVDGSITLFDSAHRFAIRRSIAAAHEDAETGEPHAVIKVDFLRPPSGSTVGGWLFTSAGNDGVVKRWDARGGTAAAAKGLCGEWRGHRGGGEGGGIMGFVSVRDGEGVVTAGDDGVPLVFGTAVN